MGTTYRVKRCIVVLLILFLSCSLLVASVSAADTEDYVDNNTSDVDSHADHGTESGFANMQSAPDSTFNTVTEAATSSPSNTTMINDGFELGLTNFDGNGASGYVRQNTAYTASGGSYTAQSGADTYFIVFPENTASQYLITDNMDMSTASRIYVQFWYMDDDLDDGTPPDFRVSFYDGSAYDQIGNLAVSTEDTWIKYSTSTTDSQYFKSNFRVRWDCTAGNNEAGFIDTVTITRESGSYNYELDLEFQWTSADYDETNEYLCIYTGTLNGESLLVQVRDTTWKTLMTLSASQWNNVSISGNLSSSTFTIRLIAGTETGDTTQSSWQIDSMLIHTWSPVAYTAEFTQSISTTWNLSPKWTATATFSQSITTSWVIDLIYTPAAEGTNYIVDFMLSLTTDLHIPWGEAIPGAWTISPDWTIGDGWTANTGGTEGYGIQWFANTNFLQSITTGFTTLVTALFNLITTQLLSFAWVINIIYATLTNLSVTLATTWNVVTSWASTVNLTQTASLSWDLIARWASNVVATQSLSTAWNLLPSWVASVSLSQTLTSTWGTLTSSSFLVNFAQSISSTFSVLNQWLANIPLTQGIGTTWNIAAASTFNTVNSLGLSFSFTVELLLSHIGTYIVDLALALTSTWEFLARWTAALTVTQNLATTWSLIINSAFSLTNSLIANFTVSIDLALSHLGMYVADLTVAISTTLTIIIQWVSNLTIIQGLETTWTLLPFWNLIADLSQSTSLTVGLLTAWAANSILSQGIATTWNLTVTSLFNTLYSLGVSASFVIEALLITVGTYVVDFSLTLNTTWAILTKWTANLGIIQAISTSWGILLQTAFRVQQGITLTFTWLIDLLHTQFQAQAYIANLTLTVSTAWETLIQWNASVELIQGIATSWVIDIVKGLQYSIELTLSVVTQWLFNLTENRANIEEYLLFGAVIGIIIFSPIIMVVVYLFSQRNSY